MSVSRIRGIAKLLAQVRQLDSGDEPFEVEAEDQVPFVQLGHWVALSGVSAGALALYWMLALHLNRTRGDRYVWPTTSVLAHMLGYSRGDKIKKFVDELVAIGAVLVIPVPDVKGPQKRNVYRLRRNPPDGYAGPITLGAFYERLSEAYEQETAGESVCPETGAHVPPEMRGDVAPETGGHVAPQAGGGTTRTTNYMKEKDAPTARSVADGRRPTTGSKGSRAGGSAASGNTKPLPLTREETRQYDALIQTLPPELAALVPKNAPRDLKQAVLDALASDSPAARTPRQLVDFRLMPKWDKHYSSHDQAGPIQRPVGVLRALLRRDAECGDGRCDERTNVDTGEPCRSCEMRNVDKRADRTRDREASTESATGPAVPAPRSEAPRRSRPAPTVEPVKVDASLAPLGDYRNGAEMARAGMVEKARRPKR